MTLVILLSTPQGLVFCADSLVTTSERVTVVDLKRSGELLKRGEIVNGFLKESHAVIAIPSVPVVEVKTSVRMAHRVILKGGVNGCFVIVMMTMIL